MGRDGGAIREISGGPEEVGDFLNWLRAVVFKDRGVRG